MAHQIARLILEHAETFLGRSDAVEKALSLGMPLDEIESYLDWLDQVQPDRTSCSSTNELLSEKKDRDENS